MKEEILNLGKLLVDELGLDNSVDTLSRWMAHYAAQQMVEVENSVGDKKIEAEERCFETILKLWKHRTYYESGKYPFERFEGIFKTLERLDPKNRQYYFINSLRNEETEADSEEQDTINKLMDMVLSIDKAARVWIKYILKQALLYSADDRTLEWLRASLVDIEDNLDSKVILKLLEDDIDEDDEDINEAIQNRINELERFAEYNKELIQMYSSELK